jgi:hypothetical protein
MKRFFSMTLAVILCFCFQSHAQFNRYLISFKDKAGTSFSLSNPTQFLSQRAIERRTRYNIAIDSTDIPVNANYIESVRQSGNITILNVSRWLNQISIFTTDAAALNAINNLPFVVSALPIASRNNNNNFNTKFDNNFVDAPIVNSNKVTGNTYQYGVSGAQVRIHKGQFLHNHGFRGENMQLAVIDAGFYHYDVLPTFDSVRNNNQILGTWDFVDREESVAEDDSHGMHCLSTIAANIPGTFVGTAPKTSFYLFRTEDVSSEYPIEEHNLAIAAERADSLGVDLCSVSLGYTEFSDPSFDYTYNDMNGNTTISAKAVDLAAKKGMLMVIAAGNEGAGSWRYISTPADADSCLTIGAVDTIGRVASFSSYGPSSDNRIKPNVAAVGRNAVVANSITGLPSFGSGTSYACPNMAGITTCLWQAFPEASNMQIINTLQKSGNIYSNPNDRIGYGIPDVKKSFVMLQKQFSTRGAIFRQCKAEISIDIKTDSTMKIEVERKFPTDSTYTTITTLQNLGNYGMSSFFYADDLSNTDYGYVNYRYKVIIDSDTSYYLDSSLVNYLNNCKIIIPAENKLTISPNPFNGTLYINLERTSDTKISIVIHSSLGQKVYTDAFNHLAGIATHEINLNHLSRGVYYVTVYANDNKEITKKIVKQ